MNWRSLIVLPVAAGLLAGAGVSLLPDVLARAERPNATPRPVTPRGPLAADENALIQLFERTRDSVVFISTKEQVRDFWSRNVFSVPRGSGSGFIWDDQGHVVTNHHVIESADEIEVALADGRTAPARVVGSDPETDLAVVKIDLGNLPAITFSQSEQLSVGDVVLAIGNPFGVGQTVTQGIVSALGRSHLGINTFENFIQTDAPINPGNSGGALINANGDLVGINSAIYSRSGGSMGIGFAIPVSLAKQIMEQIIRQGSVTRGWIGVEAQDITPELAESFKLPEVRGALIAGVMRGGPADRAGVRPGDILMEIDGKPVLDSAIMLNLVAALKPGHKAILKITRNQASLSLTAAIGTRPKPQTQRE